MHICGNNLNVLRRDGRCHSRLQAANSGSFRLQQVVSPLHKQRLSPKFSRLANSPARRAAAAVVELLT